MDGQHLLLSGVGIRDAKWKVTRPAKASLATTLIGEGKRHHVQGIILVQARVALEGIYKAAPRPRTGNMMCYVEATWPAACKGPPGTRSQKKDKKYHVREIMRVHAKGSLGEIYKGCVCDDKVKAMGHAWKVAGKTYWCLHLASHAILRNVDTLSRIKT